MNSTTLIKKQKQKQQLELCRIAKGEHIRWAFGRKHSGTEVDSDVGFSC